jgi:peptide/nickel transport system substrate-binding protein
MTHSTLNGKPVHWAAEMYAREYAEGKLSRREFLTRATSMGVTAAGAYAMIGAAMPGGGRAAAQEGGTLRIQQEVLPLKDPRTWDWSQIANYGRGFLEYLAEYENDGTFKPMLLESWEISDDATTYTLTVREGVTWNNGDPFTAEDVAHNFTRWCDATVEGNSMATRMIGLVDPETQQAREGAIEVVDERTVRLNLDVANIAIIADTTDYPAAVVHQSYDGGDFMGEGEAIGTGPYLPESLEVGVRGVLVKNPDHQWWGAEAEGFGGATLDRIEFVDYGTDPASWLAAIEAEEVDMLYESVGEFIEIMDSLDLVKSEVVTANTICIRPNQLAEVDGMRPYEDVRVRRALQLAVDNEVLLELGYSGLGVPAENHHVCPIHPEYAEIPAQEYDPERAAQLMEEAGMADFTHELISIDDDWRKNTTDAVAAQLRDAGIDVKRTILPGSTFWNDWAKFPFSSTNWNQRPLGIQALALAYRSGEAWNETGYASEEFDAMLAEASAIADADERREIMARVQQKLRDDGVVIQPYWRSVYRHYRETVTGAEMHPAFEIHLYKLGLAA